MTRIKLMPSKPLQCRKCGYHSSPHLFRRQSIVGKAPFDTIGSVVGVSLFVLITSQLLGNVAVVQLAKPNVEVLSDGAKGNTSMTHYCIVLHVKFVSVSVPTQIILCVRFKLWTLLTRH
jgi:hypothetical protein